MYDIIIIGAGPAGLCAAIYAVLANKKVLVLEKSWAGGQVANIYKINNYPGFENIDGFELSNKMKTHATNLGAVILSEEVTSVNLSGNVKHVQTFNSTYEAKAVIIASGAVARPLDVNNEKQFLGKGISYCATCDGGLYKNKTVAVVGGGNTSIEDCLYLSNLAKKIYLIHRRDVFTANESSLNKVKALACGEENKVEIITNSTIIEVIGKEKLEAIKLNNKITNQTSELKVDGLFIAIGRRPDTEILRGQLELDSGGFIVTDNCMRTSIKNVYAIGDVRNTPLRQIITACADGAVAISTFIKDN